MNPWQTRRLRTLRGPNTWPLASLQEEEEEEGEGEGEGEKTEQEMDEDEYSAEDAGLEGQKGVLGLAYTGRDLLWPPPVSQWPMAAVRGSGQRLWWWLSTLFLLLLSAYLNALVQTLMDARWFALIHALGGELPTPLMDLGFEWLPAVRFHPIIGLTPALFSIVTFCLLRTRIGVWFSEVLRRALLALAIVFLFRALCLHLTLLPPPLVSCTARGLPAFLARRTLAVRAVAILLGQHTTCADTFFSGHTTVLTVNLLVWFFWLGPRGPPRPYTDTSSAAKPMNGGSGWSTWLWLAFGLVFYVLSLALIIASRFHYTLDVVAAVFLSWAVCRLVFAVPSLQRRRRRHHSHRRRRRDPHHRQYPPFR